MVGILYGVGVGPGDPELITVKGMRILQQVPVVAFPAGMGGKPGIAQQIVAPWLQADQVELPLTFPFVQDEAVLEQAWQVAAKTVWDFLNRGQDVAFVSEGDVSFYSTFTYLAQAVQRLDPTVEVKAVPGVASPMAAAAALGLPLAVRSQRLTILPALYTVADLETAIAHSDVIVLMKVSSVYKQVWQVLENHGLLEHSYVVERATQPHQIIYADLRDRPSLQLPYFSLLVVQISGREEVRNRGRNP
ncbi:MAG: precorrin-2 C(20)-methyltransferase [Cyanobacteria bacterium J06638_20]